MTEQGPFSIEQFYQFLSQGKLMAGKCDNCGKILLPPRPLCDNCYSKKFQWVSLSGNGKLVTYTVIHVAPVQFQNLAPYAVGIVELENGLKIPGVIQGFSENQFKIGMELTLDFSSCIPSDQWPQWPRYCFRKQG